MPMSLSHKGLYYSLKTFYVIKMDIIYKYWSVFFKKCYVVINFKFEVHNYNIQSPILQQKQTASERQLNAYEVHKIRKMAIVVKLHDNICNMLVSFKLLIKTKIV